MTTNDKNYAKKINYTERKNISIIIPYLGQYGKVLDIVENINKLFYHFDKEIIIVDDGSLNKEFYVNLIKKNSYIVVRHEQTKGFGAAINSGLKQVKNKYAIVCHNDVKFFDKNCLTNLYNNMIKFSNENVALMSSVTNNPLVNFPELKKESASESPAYITNLDYLPMYCCCVHVRAILSCGGVPEHPYAWFEDVLLCNRLKDRKYNLAVCPSSHVIHEGMGTIKSLVNLNPSVLQIMKNNSSSVKNINKDNI